MSVVKKYAPGESISKPTSVEEYVGQEIKASGDFNPRQREQARIVTNFVKSLKDNNIDLNKIAEVDPITGNVIFHRNELAKHGLEHLDFTTSLGRKRDEKYIGQVLKMAIDYDKQDKTSSTSTQNNEENKPISETYTIAPFEKYGSEREFGGDEYDFTTLVGKGDKDLFLGQQVGKALDKAISDAKSVTEKGHSYKDKELLESIRSKITNTTKYSDIQNDLRKLGQGWGEINKYLEPTEQEKLDLAKQVEDARAETERLAITKSAEDAALAKQIEEARLATEKLAINKTPANKAVEDLKGKTLPKSIQSSVKIKDIFNDTELSDADKLDAGALAADIVGLGVGLAGGWGGASLASAGLGLGSTIATAKADALRRGGWDKLDAGDIAQLGISTVGDIVTAIPYVGAGAQALKITKHLPKVGRLLQIAGGIAMAKGILGESGEQMKTLAEDIKSGRKSLTDLNTDELKLIVSGLRMIASGSTIRGTVKNKPVSTFTGKSINAEGVEVPTTFTRSGSKYVIKEPELQANKPVMEKTLRHPWSGKIAGSGKKEIVITPRDESVRGWIGRKPGKEARREELRTALGKEEKLKEIAKLKEEIPKVSKTVENKKVSPKKKASTKKEPKNREEEIEQIRRWKSPSFKSGGVLKLQMGKLIPSIINKTSNLYKPIQKFNYSTGIFELPTKTLQKGDYSKFGEIYNPIKEVTSNSTNLLGDKIYNPKRVNYLDKLGKLGKLGSNIDITTVSNLGQLLNSRRTNQQVLEASQRANEASFSRSPRLERTLLRTPSPYLPLYQQKASETESLGRNIAKTTDIDKGALARLQAKQEANKLILEGQSKDQQVVDNIRNAQIESDVRTRTAKQQIAAQDASKLAEIAKNRNLLFANKAAVSGGDFNNWLEATRRNIVQKEEEIKQKESGKKYYDLITNPEYTKSYNIYNKQYGDEAEKLAEQAYILKNKNISNFSPWAESQERKRFLESKQKMAEEISSQQEIINNMMLANKLGIDYKKSGGSLNEKLILEDAKAENRKILEKIKHKNKMSVEEAKEFYKNMLESNKLIQKALYKVFK